MLGKMTRGLWYLPFFLYLDPGFSCNVTTEQLIETQLSYVKDNSSKDERSVFV